MKSIKSKLILLISLLVVVSSVAAVGIGLWNSTKTTNEIIETLYDEQLDGAGNVFISMIREEFGILNLNSQGELVDARGESIAERYRQLDQFSGDMDMVATIFKRAGSDFERVITSIINEEGRRAVGTVLDQEGNAYKAMVEGKEYIGEADILGGAYITKYIPMLDTNGNIIGVYFVGKPIEAVNNIVREGRDAAMKLFAGLVVLILLIATIMSYLIGNTIANPISALTAVVEKQGNLDFRFNKEAEVIKYMDRRDEIGIMTNALKVMEDNVRSFIHNTMNASEQIAASSEELTATSQQSAIASEEVARTIEEIAKGANEQAKDTEVSAGNVEEMGQLLQNNGEYTEELNEAIKEIDKQKEEGFHILKGLINKTKESSKASNEVYEVIVSNNESAEKIEKASSMIHSISDQTNLLALNAAIEAARAGEAGRGFAVVAEEIRKLAEETSNFTEEIKQVIEELKSKSHGAVKTMSETKHIVESQNESVKQTEEKFEMIASSIDATKTIIEKLNESAESMNSNKSNLVDLMQNLSAIAEENAAGTQEASASMEEQAASIEEIANASEELSKIAEELQVLISKFKI
ncbi:methyl-accepting chemotaxis protein [Natronincola peptidivorans]|uniref:Methyl-accepting chemotaxis protein n=1 Tax=Natronincola peptidivorans TaxID=426128 RepID=A0A1I0CIN5_9FIRM|nr:methyl-accepting chemotaxis protein [Natronincola peptidivorans]SET18827.1 methyl-accepting chemotaxis protein [Natronincola peptidivorans]